MAVDIFLELAGKKTGPVKGEAKSKECQSQIEVYKAGFSVKSPEDAATRQATGKAELEDFSFEMPVSIATPAIFSMVTSNEQLKCCKFRYRKASGTAGTTYVYMMITLDKARIVSITQGGDSEKQTNTVKIGYTKYTLDYYLQKQDGSIEQSPHTSVYDGDSSA